MLFSTSFQRTFLAIAFAFAVPHAPLHAQTPAASPLSGQPRQTPERPTALPEDKELAVEFVRAAAGYASNVGILQAAGMDTAKTERMGNWLYFNAIDLSDEAFAKAHFAKYVRELAALNEGVNRAAASGDRTQLRAAVEAMTTRLNELLADGERLYAQYGKTFNTVVQNRDGSFTIRAARRP